MKGNNFWGWKKWRRPEGRPISVSSLSLLDYIWFSVRLNRCAVLSQHPCKHHGTWTALKITKLLLVASPISVRSASIPQRHGVKHELQNLIPH